MDDTLLDRYRDAVHAIQSFIHPTHSKSHYMQEGADKSFFLKRTHALFVALGNPQSELNVVHVTGTAGKGSTATLIAHMLHADGRNTGLLTSPFVTTTLENIWINGRLCDPEIFIQTTAHVIAVARTLPEHYVPSYSELLFAIGLLCCVRSGVQWCVVEVGCGGRFDYTNIFSQPTTCVITPIDLDHTDILGNTVEDIAWHKAGIIHAGCHVWSAPQSTTVMHTLEESARMHDVRIQYVDTTNNHTTQLQGSHQQRNLALASAVAGSLQASLSAIDAGARSAYMPARCEIIATQPLTIIDGAHSPIKIRALVEYLRTLSYNNLYVIYSAKYSKDPFANIEPLLPLATAVWCTEFHLPGFSSHVADDMKNRIQQRVPQLTLFAEPQPDSALQAALQRATANDCILITGSLYLAGILRALYVSEKEIILTRSLLPLTHRSMRS